jgi:hypothetical protein
MVKVKYDKNEAKKKEKAIRKSTGRIGAGTEYSFTGANMSPFGGIFAASCFTERLGLQKLLQESITTERVTEIPPARYLLAVLYMLYIGYDRFAHIQYVKDDSIFKRILGIERIPVQSSFWRFLNVSLTASNEDQLREVNFEMQERVWQAGNIGLRRIHIDTDTTVETVYGEQENATVGYNPKHRGKKSYQPVLSTIAETGELICARQRSGATISAEEIARHLDDVFIHLPQCAEWVLSRMDSGFYCKEAVDKHVEYSIHFVIGVKKQAPIQQEIEKVKWRKSKISDGIGEFRYQPQMWNKPYRYIVTRYREKHEEIQTDMFEDTSYKYRVFVTDLTCNVEKVVSEYDGRACIENLIEESKNQIALAKIPGKSFDANALFLQLVILAFNLNKWLQLFGRQEDTVFHWEEIRTSRFKHLYIACRLVKSGHRTIIRFASDYPYKEYFCRLIDRLRRVVFDPGEFKSVIERNLIPGTS